MTAKSRDKFLAFTKQRAAAKRRPGTPTKSLMRELNRIAAKGISKGKEVSL